MYHPKKAPMCQSESTPLYKYEEAHLYQLNHHLRMILNNHICLNIISNYNIWLISIMSGSTRSNSSILESTWFMRLLYPPALRIVGTTLPALVYIWMSSLSSLLPPELSVTCISLNLGMIFPSLSILFTKHTQKRPKN